MKKAISKTKIDIEDNNTLDTTIDNATHNEHNLMFNNILDSLKMAEQKVPLNNKKLSILFKIIIYRIIGFNVQF